MQCFIICFVAKLLNLVNVSRTLSCVPCDKYVDVGLALGVDFNRIKEFEVNYPRDVQRVWKEILQSWLNSSSSHTWASLAQTLTDSNFSHFTKEFPL